MAKPKIKGVKACKTCYGKGYYSKLEMEIGYDDFEHEGYISPPRIIYVRCPKCKSKKKIPKNINLYEFFK